MSGWWIVALGFLFCVAAQIPNAVFPIFDNDTAIASHFRNFPIPERASLDWLLAHEAVAYSYNACLSNTNRPAHSVNKARDMEPNSVFPEMLDNSTYWWNEYLHVGHFHYELVLLQVLATRRIDRVVAQRAACYGTACTGIGSIESYYKGFFGIAFAAFGQPDIPFYLRYTWKQREVSPLYFDVDSSTLYREDIRNVSQHQYGPIPLQMVHCFDHVYRRTPIVSYGAIAVVSRDVIEQFRRTACRVVNAHVTRRFGLPSSMKTGTTAAGIELTYVLQPELEVHPPLPALHVTLLSPYFLPDDEMTGSYTTPSPPTPTTATVGAGIDTSRPARATTSTGETNRTQVLPVVRSKRILIAYRGSSSTRHVTNWPELVRHLQTQFPAPTYEFAVLDTSRPTLSALEQIHAVMSAYVVICNHGAFEGNMIYMRRGSLLLELFGQYGNNEVHTFHRVAMSLGLFYARLHPREMTQHQQRSFHLTREDVADTTTVLRDYFQRRAYRINIRPFAASP